MGQRLTLHPTTPQQRFLHRAADCLADGGVVVLPTDTCHALVALPGSRSAIDKIAKLKRFQPEKKLFSLVVPDLSDVARYAEVSNQAYRILKRFLPGPYTFVLPATREVPRILLARRKTIGLRVPGHEVPRRVAEIAGGAVLTTTLRLPGDDEPLAEPDEIMQRVGNQVDLVLDQGRCGTESSTLVDMSEDVPTILRAGAGDPEAFSRRGPE